MIRMMQGDQYRLPIEFKNEDGTPLTQEEISDIEIFVGLFRKTISDGGVGFEESEGVFYVFMTQKETFMLRGEAKIQARIKFLSGDVMGIDLGTVKIDTSTSKVVL